MTLLLVGMLLVLGETARALAEDKNYERALAFCKQAAALEP